MCFSKTGLLVLVRWYHYIEPGPDLYSWSEHDPSIDSIEAMNNRTPSIITDAQLIHRKHQ